MPHKPSALFLLLVTSLALAACAHFKTRDVELETDVAPAYPEHAREAGIEGRVIVEYTISKEGRPVDVRIVEAEPGGVFESAVINAVYQWRYKPARRGGRTVKLAEAEAVFTFEISDGAAQVETRQDAAAE